MMSWSKALLPLCAAGALSSAALSAQSQQDLLVSCARLVVAADTVLSPGEFLVRAGKVAFVGREIPDETRQRAKALRLPDATIVPGFVLPHSTLGMDGDLLESAFALTPDLLAKDAFDPMREELQELPRHGVTSSALSPSSANVAGGIAALVAPGLEMGSVQQDELYAKFSLVQAARSQDREPTSLMGAVALLRRGFEEARLGQGPEPANAAFGAVARGQRRMFVHAETRAELLAALALGHDLGVEPILGGAMEAASVLDEIVAARAAVMLPTLRPELREEDLRLPALLAQRGVPFCFAGSPMLLRSSAALAVQHGLPRAAALAALTQTPAELLGLAATHGTLRRGCDADFGVYSGDPIDLSSRCLAVYGDGIRLFAADQPAKEAQ
jgi:imidazolonepropionase-like amidohydrolase